MGGWGLYDFYQRIPASFDEKSQKADAIIVLTGGAERIAEGLRLLNKGEGKKLFISGVGKTTHFEELLEKQQLPEKETKKIDQQKVHMGKQAINTIGNAKETADWIAANNVKSIILVTANYHMPRALLEFEQRLPAEVEILPHPVFPVNFKRDQWRDDARTRKFILAEYVKYLMAMTGK